MILWVSEASVLVMLGRGGHARPRCLDNRGVGHSPPFGSMISGITWVLHVEVCDYLRGI